FNALFAYALTGITCALTGVIASVALGQQGSSLPGIQQHQPQVASPMRPTIVDRDLPGNRENGSQDTWTAIQDGTTPTGFDQDRRKDSNVLGTRSLNNSP